MADDTSHPLDQLDLNRSELVDSFLAFLEQERRRKERVRPADLHSSVLILLLCVTTIVTLFLLFLYWRNKYGVSPRQPHCLRGGLPLLRRLDVSHWDVGCMDYASILRCH